MMCPRCGSRHVKQRMVYVYAPYQGLMWVCSDCDYRWE